MNNVPKIDNWHQVDWKRVEANVKGLRQRIFTASRNGGGKPLKNLQKLMLRSRANWLVAIRRVTQINQGRRTPGVDREVVTTPQERLELFYWLETITLNDWEPFPTRRVTIPKGPGKTRPLGIPVIKDRIFHTIVKNALEPEWEAKFEATSYGFRPGRSTHDAIVDVWFKVNPGKRVWILDADIKGAFDHISHEFLLEQLRYFPTKPLIQKWLKAGVMVGLDLSPTPTGTPQGGIVSPLLANIALHGMEKAIGVKRHRNKRPTIVSPNALVRYADDFVILSWKKDDARRARAILADWLKVRGLELSDEKTRIVHLEDGFDFLGYNVRLHKTDRNRRGFSAIVKPSRKSQERFRNEIRAVFMKHKGSSPRTLLRAVNPKIAGWGRYHRVVNSTRIFTKLDHFIWHRAWRYAVRRHPKKSKDWVKNKYFTTVKGNSWIFYDKETGMKIRQLSKLGVIRHRKVAGTASPDDPTLMAYWERRQTQPKGLNLTKDWLWRRQKGKCVRCEGGLDIGEELNVHHKNGNSKDNRRRNLELLHETCHAQITHSEAA